MHNWLLTLWPTYSTSFLHPLFFSTLGWQHGWGWIHLTLHHTDGNDLLSVSAQVVFCFCYSCLLCFCFFLSANDKNMHGWFAISLRAPSPPATLAQVLRTVGCLARCQLIWESRGKTLIHLWASSPAESRASQQVYQQPGLFLGFSPQLCPLSQFGPSRIGESIRVFPCNLEMASLADSGVCQQVNRWLGLFLGNLQPSIILLQPGMLITKFQHCLYTWDSHEGRVSYPSK